LTSSGAGCDDEAPARDHPLGTTPAEPIIDCQNYESCSNFHSFDVPCNVAGRAVGECGFFGT